MSLDVALVKKQYVGAILSEDLRGKPPEHVPWFKAKLLTNIIVGNVFGPDWFEEVLACEDRPPYFQIDTRSEQTHPRFMTRALELGEMVWNLRDVGGFDDRVADMRTNVEGVETRIGELMGGRFFKQLGIMFAFRRPTGRKQDDFDIEYVRTDSKLGRCEVKSKLQATDFTPNTIKNTLKEAKSQLPKNETGIILLRTPEDWVPFQDGQDGVEKLRAIESAITEWFATEKTRRISSVVTFDSRTDVVDAVIYANCYFKEFKNPHCPDLSGLPEYVMNAQGHRVSPRNWTTIPELVAAWEPRR
jgi:hypothetical protein